MYMYAIMCVDFSEFSDCWRESASASSSLCGVCVCMYAIMCVDVSESIYLLEGVGQRLELCLRCVCVCVCVGMYAMMREDVSDEPLTCST